MMIPSIFVESSDQLQRIETKELARVVLKLRCLTDMDIESLTEGVRTLTCVEELVIDNHLQHSEPDWQSQIYTDLFEAIGSIPKLGIVELRCCGRNPHRRFPVSLLTTLLNAAHNHGLKELVIFRSLFRGIENDFEQFANAIQKQNSLQELYTECSLHLSRSTEELERSRASLSRWAGHSLRALANVPTLERLCMHIWDYKVPAPDSLVNLVAVPTNNRKRMAGQQPEQQQQNYQLCSLNELYLYGLYLNGPQSISLANSLAENNNIQRLALEVYDLDHTNAPALANMLRSNNTLESFDLHIRNTMEDEDCLSCIASALQENQHLTSLELYNARVVQETTEQAFAVMLQTNTTLKGLRLLEPQIPASNERHNIDFNLRLNCRGRKRILQKMEHLGLDEWVELLAQDSFDGDFLYYYLRLNPLLCCSQETKIRMDAMSACNKRRTGEKAALLESSTKRRKCIGA